MRCGKANPCGRRWTSTSRRWTPRAGSRGSEPHTARGPPVGPCCGARRARPRRPAVHPARPGPRYPRRALQPPLRSPAPEWRLVRARWAVAGRLRDRDVPRDRSRTDRDQRARPDHRAISWREFPAQVAGDLGHPEQVHSLPSGAVRPVVQRHRRSPRGSSPFYVGAGSDAGTR